jgi:hypothetical protein
MRKRPKAFGREKIGNRQLPATGRMKGALLPKLLTALRGKIGTWSISDCVKGQYWRFASIPLMRFFDSCFNYAQTTPD